MANAIQLVDPSGVIRAWMCGTCFHVGGAGTYLAQTALDALASAAVIVCGGPADEDGAK